ncbi:MAG: M28 family peptidase [Gemmatimonadaceae bacterium]|nr:M28 family peptidase [Gemmatimonadaceae bacterium]
MTLPPAALRALQGLALAIVAALLVVRASTPPSAVPATAPATEFSAERAMVHVRAMAERPHPTGSADIERVRAYLVSELRALGVAPTIQDATGVGTRYRLAGRVQNIVARIPGTRNDGRAVLLVSHYDSQGASPGAGDAASATGALLETVRALLAGPPLQHDVILLITDAEEAGLLGAAAFAREHPWAASVEMILNFEARGTEGRAFMFETGAGNLDAARVLRGVPDVSATSLMVMVYRILPNDTDLSELIVLGKPAMNFAFIDGVERYHTAHDDVGHLDVRSVQHHGAQAVALARSFANDDLPRPATGDAVFFDLPFLGLVVYPEGFAFPLALLAVALVVAVVLDLRRRDRRWQRGLVAGAAGTIGSVVGAIVVGATLSRLIDWMHAATGWGGAPEWRGIYSAAIIAAAFAVASAAWALVRRYAPASSAQAGALAVWAVLAVVVTTVATGASYVLVWPLVAVSIAMLAVPRIRSDAGRAITVLVATTAVLVMLVPLIYLLGVALGTAMAGAAAAALLTALGTWLVAWQLEAVAAPRLRMAPVAAGALALLLLLAGAVTVRPSDAYPTRANLVAQREAGDGDARFTATLVADTIADAHRHVTIRVWAPRHTLAVRMRSSAAIAGVAIDGRVVDTTRYRRPATGWDLSYIAPPEAGFELTVAVPQGDSLPLELIARSAGVADTTAGGGRRGRHAVPSYLGDATLVRRRLTF